MNERKTVPVAYVTKWTTTRGILVVRGKPRSDNFTDHLRVGPSLIRPNDWTTDKAEAETRYRAALDRAYTSATKKAKALKAAINAPPKYEDEP